MKAVPDRLDLRRRLYQAVLLTAIMLASLGLYLAVLYWRGRYATVSTRLAWDEWVPFWPAWVWVYLFPYLLARVEEGIAPAAK